MKFDKTGFIPKFDALRGRQFFSNSNGAITEVPTFQQKNVEIGSASNIAIESANIKVLA